MEDKTYLPDLEELEEDALSLCDFLIYNQEAELDGHVSPKYPNSPTHQDLFEFSTNPTAPAMETIMFCGRAIPQKQPANKLQPNVQEDHRRPLLLWRSASFSKSHSSQSDRFVNNDRSSSFRVPSTKPPATGSFRYQSSGSKKYKVLIGLAKIQPEMELSEIRKRQARAARRRPVPMPPGVENGKSVVAGGRSGSRRYWGLLRPLRCRAHLASVFARASFGCIPHLRM